MSNKNLFVLFYRNQSNINFFPEVSCCLFHLKKKSSYWKSKTKNLNIIKIKYLKLRFKFIIFSNCFFKKSLKIIYLNWIRELVLGIFFILFGFFSATSAITIIGSVADWDPLAAAVMLCWTEWFSNIFYSSSSKFIQLKIINSFKIGINFGMFVDALKLTS